MAYRFNYTHRKRIREAQAIVRVLKGETPLRVTLEQTFSDGYDAESNVVLEAIRRTKAQRIFLGKIKELERFCSIEFSDFVDSDGVYFRVKVLNSVSRKVEGLAKQLKDANEKRDPTDSESLLPVAFDQPEDNLGDRFWMVKCSDVQSPVLILSRRKFSGFSPVTSQEFQALVLPEVLRQILSFAYIQKWRDYPTWEIQWRRFVEERLGCPGAPSSPETPDEEYMERTAQWIDDAVNCFSKRFNLKDITIKGLTNEE